MGASGIGFSELLVILVIVVLLFGTRRLGSLGSDLGTAIQGFRNAMRGNEELPGHGPDLAPKDAERADRHA